MKPAPGQMDLIDLIDTNERAEQHARVPHCLFHSPARGLAGRAAEYTGWVALFGNFGSAVRSHAWRVQIGSPDEPTSRCQATALTCDVRKPDWWDDTTRMPDCDCCDTWDELLFRGACTSCAWEGNPRTRENPAVEDAMDHAWPGWQELPIVARWPDDQKKQTRWWDKHRDLFPDGWLENGGPLRTYRSPHGTRHHAGGSCHPYRGYDMGVLKPEPEEK